MGRVRDNEDTYEECLADGLSPGDEDGMCWLKQSHKAEEETQSLRCQAVLSFPVQVNLKMCGIFTVGQLRSKNDCDLYLYWVLGFINLPKTHEEVEVKLNVPLASIRPGPRQPSDCQNGAQHTKFPTCVTQSGNRGHNQSDWLNYLLPALLSMFYEKTSFLFWSDVVADKWVWTSCLGSMEMP